MVRLLIIALCLYLRATTWAWTVPSKSFKLGRKYSFHSPASTTHTRIRSSLDLSAEPETEAADELEYDYDVPEDAVVIIKPAAMKRLRELRDQRQSETLILRMGVRSGGCSGMSYVMDFSTNDEIQEDDAIDEYPSENIQCVVDAKSMLYLYGLELDYSDKLIGGGFRFYNPNAEESCGCGSSFGV